MSSENCFHAYVCVALVARSASVRMTFVSGWRALFLTITARATASCACADIVFEPKMKPRPVCGYTAPIAYVKPYSALGVLVGPIASMTMTSVAYVVGCITVGECAFLLR